MSSVSLIRAESYNQQPLRTAVETLLEPLGGIRAFVKAG
ncbi:MAG: thylakoid-associated protein, partial [Coleofasciculus sp. C2-GNP5-27]